MHNAAFTHLGLDCVYLAFDVDPRNVAQAVSSIRALGLCGINVTIPHKQSVMAGLDEIASEASMVGAVNTIVNENGRLKGYNTDVSGVLRALHSELEFAPRGKNVFIVGAGGASRAVIVAMCTGRRPKRLDREQNLLESAEAFGGIFPAVWQRCIFCDTA